MKSHYQLVRVIITTGIAMMLAMGGYAQVSKTKKEHRAYKVQPGVNVEVVNKYGKVQVLTWDKDSVKIDINIVLKSKTKERLDKVESNISFDFTSNGSYVTAKTVFASDKSAMFKEILTIRESSFGPDDETKIDYIVYVPKNCNLTLTNKFGDIYTADLNGRIKIELSHGDLKAGNFNGSHTHVDLRYGKANIKYIKEGDLLAFYANFEVQKAGDITMESKSSEVNFYNANKIKINSKRDKYYVKSVKQFTASSSFTDYKIDKITDEMIFDTRYGTILIGEVATGFSYLKINSKYSDADISFGKGAGFSFDMEAEDVDFIYPQSSARITKTLKPNNDDVFVYTGKFGNATTSRVRLNMADGNLTIKML